jgi:hypothetical protein
MALSHPTYLHCVPQELENWAMELPEHVSLQNIQKCALFLDSYDHYYSQPDFGNLLENEGAGAEAAWAKLKKNTKVQLAACRKLVKGWRDTLTKDLELEWYDKRYSTYYVGKIMDIQNPQMTKVRFKGFGKNATVDVTKDRMLPAYTTVKKAAKAPKKVPKVVPAFSDYKPLALRDIETTVVGTSRTGRVIHVKGQEKLNQLANKKLADEKAAKRAEELKAKKLAKAERLAHLAETQGDIGDEEDFNDWICTVCDNFKAPDGTQLMLCDGGCLRSYHLGCLGRSENQCPVGIWKCEECEAGAHSCWICNEVGQDNDLLDNGVFKCNRDDCGKFYHVSCLQGSEYEYQLLEKETEVPAEEEGGEVTVITSYTINCPRHSCDTCTSFYTTLKSGKSAKQKAGSRQLWTCIRCPRAFHTNCVPPGTRNNENALLCERHEDVTLPDPEFVFSCDANNQQLAAVWDSMRLALPKAPPREDKKSESHYRLPQYFVGDVSSHPPEYQMILRLDYSTLPGGEKGVPHHISEAACECSERCDENCVNRLLKIECCEKPKGLGGDICAVGGNCGNRQFKNKEYTKIQVFQEAGMGWGCRALQEVCKGTLIIEYIGEVINTAEMQKRNTDQRTNSPWDHEFYIMELDNGIFVDGKRKGNMSRFINHACDPNCQLVRWEVRGTTRIGIFAMRDIKKGESLSYDYQFDTNDRSYFHCCCGSPKCRGTMAPEKKESGVISDTSKLTKTQRASLVKAGKEKVRMEEEDAQAQELTRSYTGRWLPGGVGIHEVAKGSLPRNEAVARDCNLYLPRNNPLGEDFLARRDAFRKRALKRLKAKQNA